MQRHDNMVAGTGKGLIDFNHPENNDFTVATELPWSVTSCFQLLIILCINAAGCANVILPFAIFNSFTSPAAA